ncbi:MAG TPA: hypothetical protein VH682_13705 [Gemmataceae bacterium]|jgi:hypothetical protein
MPEHGRKYVRLRETAIVALLAHPTIAEAAKASGISERGLRKWMAREVFARAVKELRECVLQAGLARLTGLVDQASAPHLRLTKDAEMVTGDDMSGHSAGGQPFPPQIGLVRAEQRLCPRPKDGDGPRVIAWRVD